MDAAATTEVAASALFSTESAIAFATLAGLEIVLGIDNVIFISILVAKLPEHQRALATRVGLILAMVMRIGLLFCISLIMGLKADLFNIMGMGFSGKDLILLGGGLFLIGKATYELHEKLEGAHHHEAGGVGRQVAANLGTILIQIMMIDIVFSLDSVITAVGMVQHIEIMIAAVIASIGVMLLAAPMIGAFVEKHPTLKVLALAFLLLIGTMLMMEGLGQHINKGYIYTAMAFSLGVEFLNMRLRRVSEPVHLHSRGDVEKIEV